MSGEASPSPSGGVNLEGLEDVEDFVWANEGEESMSWERFSHLYDLMLMGNTAFRNNRFEEAINCYSRAHNIKPGDPIILSNRCAAYLRISQFLKHRPSSASEYRPLSGLDPTTHAGLALKDAEKVMNLRSNSASSYILTANALILLEKYEPAHQVILSGLQVDPVSVTLNNIIQRNFPEEYVERKLEHDSLTHMGVDLLPLFVMDVVLPCEKFHLNIFEARYRLLAIVDSTTGSVAEYACEVEITDCEPLPDGRFFLELESRRRCRILQNWDQDGYRVAEVEWIQDICPSEGTRERADLLEVTTKAAAYARSWMRRAQEVAQGVLGPLRVTTCAFGIGFMWYDCEDVLPA
ncbi:hypothetical protein RJ639_041815 [Escallonia herrerae]|uniref:Lon N-terminal domain-containing protein n=1 Tax=Escallonia herrerae TaxID=1293975 RepID=A0AA89B5B8_9ASTE|nr:hypothetical protein RJ639_041815 [Escallonia herrerae]